MDIINKLLDFINSPEGKLLVLALTAYLSKKYGQHFSVTEKQAEKFFEISSHVKAKGEPFDPKRAVKSVQAEIRKSIFK